MMAIASLAMKARRNVAAPIPANGLRDLLTARMDELVSDPPFPFATNQMPRINTKHPAADTTRYHISGPSIRRRRTKRFIA
jgi:hypothetical protein